MKESCIVLTNIPEKLIATLKWENNQNIFLQQTPWQSDCNQISKDEESTDFRSPTAITIPNPSGSALKLQTLS